MKDETTKELIKNAKKSYLNRKSKSKKFLQDCNRVQKLEFCNSRIHCRDGQIRKPSESKWHNIMEENENIHELGFQSCQRKFIGSSVNTVRQRIQTEIAHIINPALSKQTRFNRAVMGSLKQISQELNSIQTFMPPKIAIPDFQEVTTQEYVKNNEYRSENAINIANVEYAAFEDLFYKSDIIKKKQKYYLRFIDKNLVLKQPILDAGCGRGEFLKILETEGIPCLGVDINPAQTKESSQRFNRIIHMDIIKYLQTTDEEYSGISAFQLVEHFSIEQLREFIMLAKKRLMKNGVLIIETINPASPRGMYSYYLDSTHKRPIPMELLVFMLQFYSFSTTHIVYSNPVRTLNVLGSDANHLYHDYAVIAYKRF